MSGKADIGLNHVVRPNIQGANIVMDKRDEEGANKAFYLRAEEADKLYTDLDTGIIRGDSVFKTMIYSHDEEEDVHFKRHIFINMFKVEAIIFHTDDDEITVEF